MNIIEVRRERLHYQMKTRSTKVKDRGDMTVFAKEVGVSIQYLSSLLSGKQPIGNLVARRIEKVLGLTEGFLDQPLNCIVTKSIDDEVNCRKFIDITKEMDNEVVTKGLKFMQMVNKIPSTHRKVIFDLLEYHLSLRSAE